MNIYHPERLDGVHPTLIDWVYRVAAVVPVLVVEGLRGSLRQRDLYNSGATRTLKSYHLKQETGYGHAIDLAPYVNRELDWNSLGEFWFLGGIGKTIAKEMRVPIIWGRDWDDDNDFKDQSFNDFPHWQLARNFVIPESGFNEY